MRQNSSWSMSGRTRSAIFRKTSWRSRLEPRSSADSARKRSMEREPGVALRARCGGVRRRRVAAELPVCMGPASPQVDDGRGMKNECSHFTNSRASCHAPSARFENCLQPIRFQELHRGVRARDSLEERRDRGPKGCKPTVHSIRMGIGGIILVLHREGVLPGSFRGAIPYPMGNSRMHGTLRRISSIVLAGLALTRSTAFAVGPLEPRFVRAHPEVCERLETLLAAQTAAGISPAARPPTPASCNATDQGEVIRFT